MISIEDTIRFLRKYRVLDDWSDTDIWVALSEAIKQNYLLYTSKDDKVLDGVAFGYKVKNRFHVIAMVAPGQLKEYLKYFKQKFPDCYVTYYRNKKFKTLYYGRP